MAIAFQTCAFQFGAFQTGECPLEPLPVVTGGAHPGFKAYRRRYTDAELDLERDLDRVIEAARRPETRKARKGQLERIARPLKELLATAKNVEAAPLAVADLRALARSPEMHAATFGEWRAAIVAAAIQARNELQARREMAEEDDVEALLLMAI